MKFLENNVPIRGEPSPSMRREWIEIPRILKKYDFIVSPSMRREWIEIITDEMYSLVDGQSPSMRREWIEISGEISNHTAHLCLPPCGGSGLK